MTEAWVLKTSDGEVYNLKTTGTCFAAGYDNIYNLLRGTSGHHGVPITITIDAVPYVAGGEVRQIVTGIRTVYTPLRIIGSDAADLQRNLNRVRKSIVQPEEHQLWVTNERGETRVLYCRYQKGFENIADDANRTRMSVSVPLYLEAPDPYFYDPPGSEITRSFSSSPWSSNFFTLTVPVGLKDDALTGATRITVDNTQNLVVGKTIEITAGHVVTSDEMAFDTDLELIRAERLGAKLGDIETVINQTNVSVGTSNPAPQINQNYVINGTFTVNGVAVSGKTIQITRTDPNGKTVTYTTFTDAKGKFFTSETPGLNGVYTFLASFLGDVTHLASSAAVKVTAGKVKQTTLTLAATPENPNPHQAFKLSGALKAVISSAAVASTVMSGSSARSKGYATSPGVPSKETFYNMPKTVTTEDGIWSSPLPSGEYALFTLFGKPASSNLAGVASQTVTLYKATSRGNVKIAAAKTDKNGVYSFTVTEAAACWATYEVVYAGDAPVSPDKKKADPGLLGWLDWLFDLLFGWIEGFVGAANQGVYAGADAKLTIEIDTPLYPINYQVALPPSMVNDGELQFFGYHGFNGCILIAEAVNDDYSTEYHVIHDSHAANANYGNNMWAAIDISVVTTDPTHPLSYWHTWLVSLYDAGWRYVAGVNHGRTGDAAYLNGLGLKLINRSSTPWNGTVTPDISGTGVYHDTFECFGTASIPYIEKWATSAYGATPSVKSGVMAAVLANDSNGSNLMLTNSQWKSAPTYKDILDWSEINFVGMTNFAVWFHPSYSAATARDVVAEQLSLYKSLGFPGIVTDLRKYYPATAVTDAVTYTWAQPNKQAILLNMYYTDEPLIFTGKLVKITTDDAVTGKEISLQELPPKTLLTADVSSGHVLDVTSTVGYEDGDTITVSSTFPYTQGCTIDTDGVDPDALTITVVETIAYSFAKADKAQVTSTLSIDSGWIARGTDTTDAEGIWAVELIDATAIQAGKHQFRAVFNADLSDTDYLAAYAPTPAGMTMYHYVLTEVTRIKETNVIASVDSSTALTLSSPIVNDYLVENSAYIIEVDDLDNFLTPEIDDTIPRPISDECNLIQFWIPGCPPCVQAMAQLNGIVEQYSNITYTHANIGEPLPYGPSNNVYSYNEAGDIGTDAAAALYPAGFLFAQPKTNMKGEATGGSCGPAIPSWGPWTIAGEIMPTVIVLYRGGMFVTGWCGVHTTGLDPVTDAGILDACGPALTWRLGESYIGKRVVIPNNGDHPAFPIWTFTGPGKTPTLTNVTTGDKFQLNHELIAGEAVVVDMIEHTCASTASATFTGAGYMKSEKCPTCNGTGTIPACPTCGGSQVCPTCHGSKSISVWVPISTGSTTDVGNMYNLRFQIDAGANTMWGLAPGANVIEVEMGLAEYKKSIINMKAVQPYEGI